jgi:hypothetical protein
MCRYLAQEIVDLSRNRYPPQIIVHGSTELGMISETEFYQDLIPKIDHFFREASPVLFAEWLDQYLGTRARSPYYKDFCSNDLSGVTIKAVIYYTHLQRIFELVTDQKDLFSLQRVGIAKFLESKSPYTGPCCHQWLIRHFMVTF